MAIKNYYKRLIDKSNEIIRYIDNAINSVNNYLDSTNIEIYGIFFPQGIKLLLVKKIKRGNILPVFLTDMYDVLPLLITETGIVRGIRYKGSREGLSANGYLRIKKIEIGKMRQETYPTFITWGKFEKYFGNLEELGASYFLLHSPRLIIQKIYDNKFKASIAYPSPFTSMSIKLFGKNIFLAPFSSHALLDFERSLFKKDYVLGNKIEYIQARMNFVIYNEFGGPLIQLSTQFPAIIPFKFFKENDFLYKAYSKEGKILIGIVGILRGDEPYITDIKTQRITNRGRGNIIIFDFFSLDITLYSVLSFSNPIYLKYSAISKKDIKTSIPFFLSINSERIQNILERFSSLKNHVKKHLNAEIMEDSTNIIQIIHEHLIRQKWMIRKEKEINILSPPIMSLYVYHKLDYKPLYNTLKQNSTIEQKIKLSKLNKQKNKLNLFNIINYKHIIDAWIKAHCSHQEIIKKFQLSQTI